MSSRSYSDTDSGKSQQGFTNKEATGIEYISLTGLIGRLWEDITIGL